MWMGSVACAAIPSYLARRKPLFGDRSKGDCRVGLLITYAASLHDPPRMKRLSPAAFQHHSLALPAMSYVPCGPIPRWLPTAAGPALSRLLSGTRYDASR